MSLPCHELHPFCPLFLDSVWGICLRTVPWLSCVEKPCGPLHAGCDSAGWLLKRSSMHHTWPVQRWAGLRTAGPAVFPSQPCVLSIPTVPATAPPQPSENCAQKKESGCSKRVKTTPQASRLCWLWIHTLTCCLLLQLTVMFASPDCWQDPKCLCKPPAPNEVSLHVTRHHYEDTSHSSSFPPLSSTHPALAKAQTRGLHLPTSSLTFYFLCKEVWCNGKSTINQSMTIQDCEETPQ